MLRILAERNRPHGQMLGEEAQEALQGKSGVPPVWQCPLHSYAASQSPQLLFLTENSLLSQRPGEHLSTPCNIHLFLCGTPQLPKHLEESAYPGLHQVSLRVRAQGQASS